MSLKNVKNPCGATCKSSGNLCPNPCVTGMKRCRLHGGKSLSGSAHPKFKNGRYSKHLPKNLLQKFEESQSDKELLELSREISLIDAQIAHLLDELEGAAKKREQQIWSEVNELVEHRRRLVLAETTRQKLLNGFVPVTDVIMLVDLILTTVSEEIVDSEQKSRLMQRLNFQARKLLSEK